MYFPRVILNTDYSNERFFQKKEGMSQMYFNPKDISHQTIYLLNNHPHPHHIRDKASRYLYMNLAMRKLLNIPTGGPIEGKRLSEIKPDSAEFFEGLHQ